LGGGKVLSKKKSLDGKIGGGVTPFKTFGMPDLSRSKGKKTSRGQKTLLENQGGNDFAGKATQSIKSNLPKTLNLGGEAKTSKGQRRENGGNFGHIYRKKPKK